MKNICLRGTMQKTLIILPCTTLLALLFAIQIAAAQVPGSVHEKAPKRVIEELAAGNPQDLIVVFDDKVAQRSAAGFQSMTALPSHDSRVI